MLCSKTHVTHVKKTIHMGEKGSKSKTEVIYHMPNIIDLESTSLLWKTQDGRKTTIRKSHFWTIFKLLAGIHQNVRGGKSSKNITKKIEPKHYSD